MRRFTSLSHWGLYDVTPWPWSFEIEKTDVIWVWHAHDIDPYDGTE